MSTANKEYAQLDTTTDDIPQGADTVDNTYSTRAGQRHVPVVKDETPVEQPNDKGQPGLR
jgi:hypothetical protein